MQRNNLLRRQDSDEIEDVNFRLMHQAYHSFLDTHRGHPRMALSGSVFTQEQKHEVNQVESCKCQPCKVHDDLEEHKIAHCPLFVAERVGTTGL